MNLPNKLTVLRICIVPFFVFFMLAEFVPHRYLFALILFCGASYTDHLDGKIARRDNLITNFGKLMDPLADKILVISALICLVIGVVYGGFSGYIGGKTDMILMRIVDILYAIPNLLLVILIMLVFGSNVTSIMIGICLTSWIGMARMVRAQVMSLKEQEFALAAYVLGASKSRILFKHLVINCMGSIIVNVTLLVPSAIFTEAFLSFVGIGISAPAASWGTLANEARSLIESSNPIQIIWPILAICLTMLSLNFIGDGVSDAFDPKKK